MSEQPAAGWYRDPTGRFDHRYWDGGSWTEHVSRNGRATTDPLDGSGAPADTEVSAGASPSWETGTGQPWHTGSGQTWEATADAAPSWQAQPASTRTNTKAIVSLVLSIIWIGGLASIAAVILGVMAKRELRQRPDDGGHGVATAGIIIGVIGIVGGLLILVAVLAFASFGMGDHMMVHRG